MRFPAQRARRPKRTPISSLGPSNEQSSCKQINHAELVTGVSPFNPAFDSIALPGGQSLASGSPQVLAYLNGLITTQAQMIAYLDDFKLMALVTLACIPLLLLLRRKAAPMRAVAQAAAME